MTIEEIVKELYPMIKAMKSTVGDVVVIDGYHIIALSCGSKLSVITLMNDTGIHIECMYSDIEAFCNPKIECDVLMYNYDLPMYYRVIDIFNRHTNGLMNPVAISSMLIQDHPELAKMKSDEPYKVINVNGITIMMIPGIINASKGDTVALYIYDNGNNTYTLKFDVYKKKIKTTISIYLVQFKLS